MSIPGGPGSEPVSPAVKRLLDDKGHAVERTATCSRPTTSCFGLVINLLAKVHNGSEEVLRGPGQRLIVRGGPEPRDFDAAPPCG
jgi:hypothetical protein